MESDERALFEALDDPKWDARTLAGLSRSTGLSSAKIIEIAAKYPDLIDMYTSYSHGVVLQLRRRTKDNAPFIEKALDYISAGKRRRIA
jgi:hypothetical protein